MRFTPPHDYALNVRNRLIHSAFLTSQAPPFPHLIPLSPIHPKGPITR